MEELISRISRKISEEQEGEIWITKLDFDYAYGQIKSNDTTKNLCIFTVTGEEFTGYYPFLKGFYGLADIPTIFQERIERTLEFKLPAWLDDIIIVTNGTIEKHESETKETMEKLDEAGYRLHLKKCEFFKKEVEWVGHKINQDGIRPLQDKLEAITKRNEKRKRTKILSGSNTIFVKVYQKSISTDRYTQKITEKTKRIDLDRRTHKSVQQIKEINHPIAMPSALQLELRKYPNNRCKYKGARGSGLHCGKNKKMEI